MQTRFAGLVLFVASLLLFGSATSSSEQAPTPSATQAQAPSDFSPERPLPQSVDEERGFASAVERGTRTRTGRPGPNLWQQEVEYDLTARLYPSEKRLDGRATIQYTNNAPDTLDRLPVELLQNLHKPSVARFSPSEVTGGVTLHRVVVNGTTLRYADCFAAASPSSAVHRSSAG